MEDVSKMIELLDLAKEKKTLAKKLLDEANELTKKAENMCPHCVTKTISEYIEGSYLDRAKTEFITKCAICGKTLSTKIESHPWYS